MTDDADETDPEIEQMRESLYTNMGMALSMIQSVERMLRFVMTIVIQKKGGLTIEKLQSQEKAEADKTIGYFLTQLRHRADVHPKLDSILKTFHEHRNIFVHDLTKVEGGGVETREQITTLNKFVFDLSNEAYFILRIFTGFMLTWSEQTGIKAPGINLDEIVTPQFREFATLTLTRKGPE